MHHPADPVATRCLKDVVGPDHVGRDEGEGGDIAVWNGDESGQMKDQVHALDEAVDKGRIANVTQPHIKLRAELRVQVVEPATGTGRRV